MIEQILALGDDAFSNLFDIVFGPIPGSTLIDPIRLRATNFKVPGQGVTTYDIRYKTQHFSKPTPNATITKSFSINFRLDKYWSIYGAFLTWSKMIADPTMGTAGTDALPGGVTPFRTTTTVISTDAEGLPTGGHWEFTGVYVEKIPDVSFGYAQATALELDIGFQFFNMLNLSGVESGIAAAL